MAAPAPAETRVTVERYFGLVDEGVLEPDDRVELLEGVVVSMSPQNPPHAAMVSKVARVLARLVGDERAVRVQLPFIAGAASVPEPDVAIVAGREDSYITHHPTSALVVVEVADSSLAQDRLTKAAIYAGAGVPQYMLVNLRHDCVEVFRTLDRAQAYLRRRTNRASWRAHPSRRVGRRSRGRRPAASPVVVTLLHVRRTNAHTS